MGGLLASTSYGGVRCGDACLGSRPRSACSALAVVVLVLAVFAGVGGSGNKMTVKGEHADRVSGATRHAVAGAGTFTATIDQGPTPSTITGALRSVVSDIGIRLARLLILNGLSETGATSGRIGFEVSRWESCSRFVASGFTFLGALLGRESRLKNFRRRLTWILRRPSAGPS